MKKLLISAAFIGAIVAGTLPKAANTAPLPLPTPVPPLSSASPTIVTGSQIGTPGTLPNHYPTYVKLTATNDTCYHVAASQSVHYTCPMSSATASPSGSDSDMRKLVKYVNYIEDGTPSGFDELGSTGIKMIIYEDAALISNANGPHYFTRGIQHTIRNSTAIGECLNTLPQSMSFNVSNYDGAGLAYPVNIFISQSAAGCGGSYYSTILGNLTPGAIQAWRNDVEFQAYYDTQNTNIPVDTSKYAPVKLNVYMVRWDDMYYPGQRVASGGYCVGPAPQFTSLSPVTPALNGSGCSNSNTPAQRWEHPYFQIGTYPNFMNPGWVKNAQDLFRMPKTLGMKSGFNDMTDPTMAVYFMTPDRANLDMAQCENCINRFAETTGQSGGGHAAQMWDEATWIDHLNSAVVAQTYGVHMNYFNFPENTLRDMTNIAASIMLATIDPNLIVVRDSIGGPASSSSVNAPAANSHLPISPYNYLIPTQPLNRPASFSFNPFTVGYVPGSAPKGYGVGTMRTASGAYLQEFAKCYNGSTGTPVAIGGCAVVVVPDGVSGATMPATTQTYTHTANITGSGVINDADFGTDTGALNLNGAAPPATGTAIASSTSYILTP